MEEELSGEQELSQEARDAIDANMTPLTQAAEEPTEETPQELNVTLVLAESVFAILHAIIPLGRLQVEQGNIQDMQMANQLQQGMARLGELLLLMESPMVKAATNVPPPGAPPSGLILPR